MPRKRKTRSVSPLRKPSSALPATWPNPPPPSSSELSMPQAMSNTNNNEELLCNMCDMFSNLDPSLIDMVLSEYKEVDVVMDYLLELSNAAKADTQHTEAGRSGFDTIASTLDGSQEDSLISRILEQVPDDSRIEEICSDTTLTKDFDLLLDEALDKYSNKVAAENVCDSEECCMSVSSAINEVPLLDQATSTKYTSFSAPHTAKNEDGEISMFTDQKQRDVISCDSSVSNLTKQSEVQKTEMDFRAKLNMLSDSKNCTSPEVQASPKDSEEIQMIEELYLEKVNQLDIDQADTQAHTSANASSSVSWPNGPLLPSPPWNPLASPFYPNPIQNSLHRFLTPIATSPLPWNLAVSGGMCFNPSVPAFTWNINRLHSNPKHVETAKPIVNPDPLPTAPLVPTIIPLNPKRITHFGGKVLILLRGAPGSGKTTLARHLLKHNPVGCILSTDDYFMKGGQYQYDPNCLEEAHAWNHKRAKEAFKQNISPIIIDNTNLQGWEMKPYVSLAYQYKYKVMFREPETWWKFNPKELERRNTHGVSKQKIASMLENYERSVGVNAILNLPLYKEHTVVHGRNKKLGGGDGQNSLQSSLNAEATEFTLEAGKENVPDTYIVGNVPQNSYLSESSQVFEEAVVRNESCIDSSVAQMQDSLISPGLDIHRDPISENNLSQISLEEDLAFEEDISSSNNEALSKIERPELLNFIGDWPIEQTMGQRVPRNRKKTKANIINYCDNRELPTQRLQEEGSSKQQESDTVEQDALLPNSCKATDNTVDLQPNCDIVLSTDSCGEADQIELKNEVHTFKQTLQMDEDRLEREGQTNLEDQKESTIVLPGMEEVIVNMQNLDISNIRDESYLVSTDKKPKQSKRNCRHCKLALTFTSSRSSSFETKENQTFCHSLESEGTCIENIKCSQTEPHEFALAWRVEKNMDISDSIKILIGKSERFKSKLLDTDLDSQDSIPYRVMHDKSTFVEENELISLGDQDSLNILCKLFRSVSFDVLKDLFERCNKDIVWATNLLLDSGEKFYKEEDCKLEELRKEAAHVSLESCCHLDDDLEVFEQSSKLYPSSYIPVKYYDLLNEQIEQVDKICTLSKNPINNDLLIEDSNITINSSGTDEYKINQSKTNQKMEEDIPSIPMFQSSDIESEPFNIADSEFNLMDNNVVEADDNQEMYCIEESRHDLNLQNDLELGEISKLQKSEDLVTEEINTVKKSNFGSVSKECLRFDHLELSLTPELAFQLSELFGPVGIDPGSLTIEDCVVRIDLTLAEAIHKRWKESIMERHKEEALSYQLLFGDNKSHEDVQLDNVGEKEDPIVIENAFVSSNCMSDMLPFMDQWNTQTQKVSLRQIMSEEIALQEYEELKRSSIRKNCAAKLKEKQLFEMFPCVEQKLLTDIFMENNYSFEKTKQFMCSVLEADPVQNVIAPGIKQMIASTSEKTKEKKSKVDNDILSERYFQDFDYPDYDDFRAEAFLYRKKQQESFRKAEEAHNRGMKQVATYYAQQGYIYAQKMREENHRAALQIFQRANEFLLPENILDLHGLHVDEAMKHFRNVLQDKLEEYKQNGSKPYLSVITGRGNHSQGGVARIKPVVIDYLTSHDYRFLEIRPGVLRVQLK